MIAEQYLKSLKLESKKFKKNKEIFDIVLYGSTTRSKRNANDIDVVIIFQNLPLKDRLEISQKFKKSLQIKNIDIKSININELFDKTFLARQGIITEGKSLIDDKPFSKKIGFSGFGLFNYSLEKLSNTEKTKFSYALNGRRQQEGILKKLKAKRLGKGVIIIPINKSDLFAEFLETWKIEFKQKHILIPNYE